MRLIFNDDELDRLLVNRKNIENAKKSFILYFLTIPDILSFEEIYFPESTFLDSKFMDSIIPFIKKYGLSVKSEFVHQDELEYSSNPVNRVKVYYEKYNFSFLHYHIKFGKRRIQKSPKYDEYIINSQYNWTNVYLVLSWCKKNNVKLLIDLDLSFFENSSEDYYIHMRQVLWEGIDLFRRFNCKFNEIKLMIYPFYPKLRGLKDTNILDPINIAHITLRCINECLSKEKMDIVLRSCDEFSIYNYMKYCKFYEKKFDKISYSITAFCLKEYLMDWNFNEKNLEIAHNNFRKELSSAGSLSATIIP